MLISAYPSLGFVIPALSGDRSYPQYDMPHEVIPRSKRGDDGNTGGDDRRHA